MRSIRKPKRTLFLLVWNLMVWSVAIHFSQGIASAQSSPSVTAEQQAQIAKGRQVVAQTCAACHTTIQRMVQVHKQSVDQWKDTIYFMISRGAQIMPDEIEPVAVYLAATGGTAAGGPRAGGGRGGGGPQAAEGDGRAIHQRTCQQCHELATASTKLATEDWSAVVARMMNYGAKLTPADQQKLIEYLNGLAK
jgi:mono/diheme cytochrome c family protein